MNMTPDPASPPGSWKTLQTQLKAKGADGERHPFFPLAQLTGPAEMLVNAGPFFEGFHGQYSLVELDVLHEKKPYRLCVSGSRLAARMSEAEPMPGDRL